ncbi:MFS general substrate transporter [Trichoderma reesei RUT C-30]|uniref:MFS general substrate transporter n=1 Tax=Hypocrea jecorina (strain ATCC 56765 / BCRC 32924 / NRRL 11460 / Rut C-30) TaxID=1344414 RepID=A0A024S4W5_HYPJR|nr:MFS general substrate transporter [Trichoderma reesei RUT C-30]
MPSATPNKPPSSSPLPPHDIESQQTTTTTTTTVTTPLLSRNASPSPSPSWSPPPGFIPIQLAIMTNVFLNGFDGTITAATYAVIGSEFDAANSASWLTTAYLVTAAAFQPLYGRVSDIFGRRACFFVSTAVFAAGCVGCGLAGDIVLLNWMRALTGVGGAGLMTMATIINSDMIPFHRRGMYQAMQNGVFGFGAICGASFGGTIADSLGWRWCFLLQVPLSMFALVAGHVVLKDEHLGATATPSFSAMWKRVDFSGALLLVLAVSTQLLGLSLGGNELPWDSPWVLGALATSVVLFAVFVRVEERTAAMPIIPLRMLRGRMPVATQVANVCAGMSSYGYLFMLPLFFQSVLQDSATKAGVRLAVPSLAIPLGGLVAGTVMSRWGKLIPLMRAGLVLMTLGQALVSSWAFADARWKYVVYIFPSHLGTGIVYPAILFISIASHAHSDHAVSASTTYLIRSLGSVWGVSVASAIVQNTLSVRLPQVLSEVPDKWRVIDEIRHSVEALRTLPPDVQLRARLVYFDGLKLAFGATTAVAAVGVVAAFVANPANLRKTHAGR